MIGKKQPRILFVLLLTFTSEVAKFVQLMICNLMMNYGQIYVISVINLANVGIEAKKTIELNSYLSRRYMC